VPINKDRNKGIGRRAIAPYGKAPISSYAYNELISNLSNKFPSWIELIETVSNPIHIQADEIVNEDGKFIMSLNFITDNGATGDIGELTSIGADTVEPIWETGEGHYVVVSCENDNYFTIINDGTPETNCKPILTCIDTDLAYVQKALFSYSNEKGAYLLIAYKEKVMSTGDNDIKVKVNAADTETNYLWDKLSEGNLISLAIDGSTNLTEKISVGSFAGLTEMDLSNFNCLVAEGDDEEKYKLSEEQLHSITQRGWQSLAIAREHVTATGGDDDDFMIKSAYFEIEGAYIDKNLHYKIYFDDGNPRCCGRLIGIGASDEATPEEIDWTTQRNRMVLVTAKKINDNSPCWFNILEGQIVGANQFPIAADHNEQIYHVIKALFILDVENECWHLLAYEKMKEWVKRVPATEWVGVEGVGEPPLYASYQIRNLPFKGFYKVTVYIDKGIAAWYTEGAYYVLFIDYRVVDRKREILYSFISGTGHTITGDHSHNIEIDTIVLGFEPIVYSLQGSDLSLEKTADLCEDRFIHIKVAQEEPAADLFFDLATSYAVIEYKGKTLGHDCYDYEAPV